MNRQNKPLIFALSFIVLFLLFYYFNIWFFRATNPGPHYIAFLSRHLNYIQWLRQALLFATSGLLKLLGFGAIFNNYQLLVAGHGIVTVVYSCLALGVLSFFAAFILAYPKPIATKVVTLFCGIIIIEFLNIIRLALLGVFGNKKINSVIDDHSLFNAIMYVTIAISLYFWIKHDIKNTDAKN